jgi:bacterioferritin-associated ferredoxin
MFVCVCLAVTEAEVDAAIAGGAHTREAVTRLCRAGGDCGACHGMIDQKIEDHLDSLAPAVTPCPAPVSGERLVSPDRLVASARNKTAA